MSQDAVNIPVSPELEQGSLKASVERKAQMNIGNARSNAFPHSLSPLHL